jgi:predicted amidophosphoribosyltransferase
MPESSPIDLIKWLIFAILALPFAVFWLKACIALPGRFRWIRYSEQVARWQKGLCPRCGYDLRATPELCPECGAKVKPARFLTAAVQLSLNKNTRLKKNFE